MCFRFPRERFASNTFFCFMQHIWIGTNGIHLYIRTHTEASNRKFERIRGTLLPLTFVSYTFPCRRFMKEVKKGKKSNNKTPETYAFIEQRWYCRCLCHHHTHWIHLFLPQKSQNRHLSFAALCMQLFDTKKNAMEEMSVERRPLHKSGKRQIKRKSIDNNRKKRLKKRRQWKERNDVISAHTKEEHSLDSYRASTHTRHTINKELLI